jgi:hypothetical protein
LCIYNRRRGKNSWFSNIQHIRHSIALALKRSKIAKLKKHMKQHRSMNKPFKAKALLAIVVQPLAALGSSPRLTSGSNRSLRSLGRAKARPLTKR